MRTQKLVRSTVARRAALMGGCILALTMIAGCYKLQEGVGDRGFAPEKSTQVLTERDQPDARQPDLTTQDSMADRAAADAVAKGQATATAPAAAIGTEGSKRTEPGTIGQP